MADVPWTPGPWTVKRDQIDNNGPDIETADGMWIAWIQANSDRHPNADLIALAPIMAEAILGCTAINGRKYAADADPQFEPIWKQLRKIVDRWT